MNISNRIEKLEEGIRPKRITWGDIVKAGMAARASGNIKQGKVTEEEKEELGRKLVAYLTGKDGQ